MNFCSPGFLIKSFKPLTSEQAWNERIKPGHRDTFCNEETTKNHKFVVSCRQPPIRCFNDSNKAESFKKQGNKFRAMQE
eukprot:scaffold3454_cov45-Cylindrotheca_fusiformis.AAC.1